MPMELTIMAFIRIICNDNFVSSPPPTVQTSNNNHISDDNLLGYLNMTNNTLLTCLHEKKNIVIYSN